MATASVNSLETRSARLAGLVSAARIRLVAAALAAGLCLAAFLALAWLAGGILLDLIAPLPVLLRTAVFGGWWIAVATALSVFVALPGWRRPLLDSVALRIERALGGIQNRLLTVLDLHRGGAATRGWKGDSAREGLVEKLVEQTETKLVGFAPGRVVRWWPLVRGAGLAAAVVALLAGMQAGLGERFAVTLDRLLHPTADIPPATWLQLASPGEIEVLQGDGLEIKGKVTRGSVDGVDLVISSADGRSRREPMRMEAPGLFSAALEGLDADATYRLEGGSTWTKTHAIHILKRPVIDTVSRVVRLPEYMRIDTPRPVSDDAVRIDVPQGSTVDFVAEVIGGATSGTLKILDRKLETTMVERIDERVWFEDDLPRDAVAPTPWKWTTSHAAGGLRAFTFGFDGRPLEMRTRLEPLVLPKESLDDRALMVMVRSDAADAPTRLSMQLAHEGGGLELVWGDDAAGPPADLRVPRVVVGPLPRAGEWARVTAALSALPQIVGRPITAVTFAIDKGRMLLDRPGWMERSMQPLQQPVDHSLGELPLRRKYDGGETEASGSTTWLGELSVAAPAADSGATARPNPFWATLELQSAQGHPSRPLAPVEILATVDRPPSLVVEEPQAESLSLLPGDEVDVSVLVFDDWGIDQVAFVVGPDAEHLGDPVAIAEVPLIHRPPESQLLVSTTISSDRLGLAPGNTAIWKLAVRDTKGQWAQSRPFRIMVLSPQEVPPPSSPLPALDEALREATQALRLAEKNEDVLDRKREETLRAIGEEPLKALDRAEEATAAAKQAATVAAEKAADPQATLAEQADAATAASAEQQKATEQTAAAQQQTDAAAAALAEPAKQDLQTLDEYLERRREDVGQVAARLDAAVEQAKSSSQVADSQREQLAAAAESARALQKSLQPSPQFQAEAAKVDRLADAPKPSEIANRLEEIAQQARAVAQQLDAAGKSQQLESLAEDLARRANALDVLGQQRQDLQANDGQPPAAATQAALDQQARNDVRQINQILGPDQRPAQQPPSPPKKAATDPLDALIDSGKEAAREAADSAARIADQLAGRQPPAPDGALQAQQQGQAKDGQPSEGQPGEGKQGEGKQGEGQPGEAVNPQAGAPPPSAKELDSLLSSKEVKQALQMADRARRLQEQASRRAAEKMAAGQQSSSEQQGQGEGAPGATPTGEPTQTATDGGAKAGRAALKEADLRGLDAARRAAIYKLPPRVRDPLLEGMRQRGPAAYQEVIDTYFRNLGRDIPQ